MWAAHCSICGFCQALLIVPKGDKKRLGAEVVRDTFRATRIWIVSENAANRRKLFVGVCACTSSK